VFSVAAGLPPFVETVPATGQVGRRLAFWERTWQAQPASRLTARRRCLQSSPIPTSMRPFPRARLLEQFLWSRPAARFRVM